ncbi:cold-responsive protein kinase 1 isoform X3 [Carya illinoinensis]|uniref:cold-responsive protein kinase 1 isoform X3 n=1 Tax=Carya illinoinensis TaxID=32201 RepID=UPI001C71AF57|nr:cold-responsive protein kinase 1 isoform X3 [Carya illinoinensis]
MTCFHFSFSSRKRGPKCTQGTFDVDDDVSGIHNVKLYPYKELRAATADFSQTNKIGEGGFGSVYKGRLKDGKIAAIKVLSAESKQGVKEFLTEINVISEIEHENLVKLYGCCVEENHRILVYNYLENNSLAQTLIVSGGSQSNMYFKWRTRTKICIGIARGLAFLHEEVRPHIIHRDIKASNILLDKDLTPKISDFGLAKLIPPNMTHVSTRVAGTIGYLAPEYAIKGQLTRKADIYSFGVLLLEIVSGRCNTNTRLPFEEQYLLERICFSSAFFSLHTTAFYSCQSTRKMRSCAKNLGALSSGATCFRAWSSRTAALRRLHSPFQPLHLSEILQIWPTPSPSHRRVAASRLHKCAGLQMFTGHRSVHLMPYFLLYFHFP